MSYSNMITAIIYKDKIVIEHQVSNNVYQLIDRNIDNFNK